MTTLYSRLLEELLVAENTDCFEKADVLKDLLDSIEPDQAWTDEVLIHAITSKMHENINEIGEMVARDQGKLSKAHQLDEAMIRAKNTILTGFLPPQLSQEELTDIIVEVVTANQDASIGTIFKYLRDNHYGQYKASDARGLAQELVNLKSL